MPRAKDPPYSKELKKRLQDIQYARNRAKSNWSFGGKRIFSAFLEHVGYTKGECEYVYPAETLNKPITPVDIDKFFDFFVAREHLEEYVKLNNPSAGNLPYYENNEIVVDTQIAVLPPDKRPATAYLHVRQQSAGEINILDVPADDVDMARLLNDVTSAWQAKPAGQKATLHPKQAQIAKAIFDDFVYGGQRGQLLLAGTGTGKTYVMGSVLRNLIDAKFHEGKTVSPWPYVVVTKASVVIQTERVLQDEFGLDCITMVHVLNIEQLRASFGSLFIEDTVEIDSGEARQAWRWKQLVHPFTIFWDECQILKNEDSQQSRIAQDFNRVAARYKVTTLQLFSSATPFARVCEGRCFGVSTGIKHNYGVLHDIILLDEHWRGFAQQVAAPADPDEYSPAAMERFRDKFDKYIKQMKNVRPKYHARNSIQRIHFKTSEERAFYESAWERFLEEKGKIEGNEELTQAESRLQILVQFLKFRQAAELCRAPRLAEYIADSYSKGQAPCAAVCFKETINKIVWHLIHEHGWKRDDISIIWGGNTNQVSKKKKAAIAIKELGALDAFKDAGISLDDLGLHFEEDELVGKTIEELEFERVNRLGPQDFKKRQHEIDRFQYGKSRCCLFTFKSGGVGLSLHHQYPNGKQRICLLTPTYSAMELIQGLGRCPRLTSLSDTPQTVVFYAGTIEEHVAQRVGMKMKCLSKMVRQRESWESCIIGQQYETTQEKQTADDIDESLGGTYIEDDTNGDSKS